MQHTMGDLFAFLDVEPGDQETLKGMYDRYPQLAPDTRPVRIIKGANRRAYGFSVQLPALVNVAGTLQGTPHRILPFDPTRVKATIMLPPSSGAFTDFTGAAVPTFSGIARLGQSSDVSGGGGFTLYPGASRDVESVEDLYIAVSAPCLVSVWVEADPEE